MSNKDSIKQQSILNMDASTLASQIRDGRLTSSNIIQVFKAHIKKTDSFINAVVENRFTQAIEQAKEYDKRARAGKFMGPLHGVPISIKESFDVKGMKTTGGLIHRQDFIAKTDAVCIDKLKKAGAIILVKTNTPTLCFCQETDNKLYGRTNNPWNITKTAGGSSGGEGALVAVGGTAFGLGSDIGGSIRFPSHFNGVIGFKSGKHQVSQLGHYPFTAHPLQERMHSIGPMGKSVRDIKLINNIIQETPDQGKETLKYPKIIFLPALKNFPLSKSTQDLYNIVKNDLSSSFSIQEDIPPYFQDTALLWQEIMSIDGGKSIQREGFTSDRSPYLREYLKEKTTNTSQYHKYFTWALIGAAMFKPHKQRRQEIEKIIGEGDQIITTYLKERLIIFPVYHQGARPHGTVYNEIFSIRKTYQKYLPFVAYANVWGLPSLTLPITKDENNMPIGLQIISSLENESTLFNLAEWLEMKYDGYIRCNTLDNPNLV